MSPPVAEQGADLLAVLRARLAPEGLRIVLPVDQPGFDALCAGSGGPSLASLLAGAAGAIVVGDGGPEFFSRFQSSIADFRGSDPLDDYTRARVSDVVGRVLGPGPRTHRLLYPFERPLLPFQRIGQAAGIPAAGPLGIQIHPTYGPWWAYRALIVVSTPLVVGPAILASCADCPQPCVAACPGRAVAASGFSPDRCTARRRLDPACGESCAARIACPIGVDHRYPREQLAFHMIATLAQIASRSPASS